MSRIRSLFCGVRKGNCAPYRSELFFLPLFWARGFFPSTWTCASTPLLNQMTLALGRSRRSRSERAIHHAADRPAVTLLSCLWKLRLMSHAAIWRGDPVFTGEELWFMGKWCELMSLEWDRPPVRRSSLSLSVFVKVSRFVWESQTSSVIVWRCSRCLSALCKREGSEHIP